MSEQFYSNREMYELIKTDINTIHTRLDRFENEKINPIQIKVNTIETILRDYNGLWAKVDNVENKIDEIDNRVVKIESDDSIKDKFTKNTLTIISTFVAIGMFIIALVK